MKKRVNRYVLMAVLCAATLCGCKEAEDEQAADVGIPPPSRVGGTVALVEESGTFVLDFASSPKASGLSPRAAYAVSGSLTIGGATFTLTGTYESLNYSIIVSTPVTNVSGSSVFFRIFGLHLAGSGFSGTIEYFVNNIKAAVGSVAGSESTTVSPVVNYLGTFSGGQAGSWNMTIRDGSLVGSYSNADPDGGSGTYRGTVTGSTIVLTSATNIAGKVNSFTGGGTLSGSSVNGTWGISLTTEEGDESYSGTWSGTKAE